MFADRQILIASLASSPGISWASKTAHTGWEQTWLPFIFKIVNVYV